MSRVANRIGRIVSSLPLEPIVPRVFPPVSAARTRFFGSSPDWQREAILSGARTVPTRSQRRRVGRSSRRRDIREERESREKIRKINKREEREGKKGVFEREPTSVPRVEARAERETGRWLGVDGLSAKQFVHSSGTR